MTEIFDLTIAKDLFDFVFRLYNFVEVAIEDDRTLLDTWMNVGKLHSEVKGMNLRALTTQKHETEGDDDADNGPMESDILSDVALMEALDCAGYTIPPEVQGFKSLLPVSASFREEGND